MSIWQVWFFVVILLSLISNSSFSNLIVAQTEENQTCPANQFNAFGHCYPIGTPLIPNPTANCGKYGLECASIPCPRGYAMTPVYINGLLTGSQCANLSNCPSGTVSHDNACVAIETGRQEPSPFKQIKNGVSSHTVTCKTGFVLIEKLTNGSVACVKPQTAKKLAEHRWGIIIGQVTTKSNYSSINGTWIEMNPLQCPDYAQDTIRDWWSKTHNNATYPVGQGEDTTTIKNYYKNLGIIIYDVKKVESGYGVCAACGCPEGYTLKILVSNFDVKKMSHFGFEISKVQQP